MSGLRRLTPAEKLSRSKRRNSRQGEGTSSRSLPFINVSSKKYVASPPQFNVASTSNKNNLKPIIRKMKLSINDPKQQKVLLDQMTRMCLKSRNMKQQMFQVEAGEAITEAMAKHHADPVVIKSALRALAQMDGNSLAIHTHLVLKGVGAELIHVLDIHKDNKVLQELALECFAKLSNCPTFVQYCFNTPVLSKKGENKGNVLELLISCIEHHSENAQVQANACKASRSLLLNVHDPLLQKRLIYDMGLLEIIVTALRTHLKEPKVQEYGAEALFYCKDHFYGMMNLGLGEVITKAFKIHQKNWKVIRNYGKILSKFCSSAPAAAALFDDGFYDAARGCALYVMKKIGEHKDPYKVLKELKIVDSLVECLSVVVQQMTTMLTHREVLDKYVSKSMILEDEKFLQELMCCSFLSELGIHFVTLDKLYDDLIDVKPEKVKPLQAVKTRAMKMAEWAATMALILVQRRELGGTMVENSFYMDIVKLAIFFPPVVAVQVKFVLIMNEMKKYATGNNKQYMFTEENLENALFNAQFQFEQIAEKRKQHLSKTGKPLKALKVDVTPEVLRHLEELMKDCESYNQLE